MDEQMVAEFHETLEKVGHILDNKSNAIALSVCSYLIGAICQAHPHQELCDSVAFTLRRMADSIQGMPEHHFHNPIH